MASPTNGKCPVCGGRIMRDVKEYNPKSGPLIFGSGSKNQSHEVDHGLYCEKCKIKFQEMPPQTVKEPLLKIQSY